MSEVWHSISEDDPLVQRTALANGLIEYGKGHADVPEHGVRGLYFTEEGDVIATASSTLERTGALLHPVAEHVHGPHALIVEPGVDGSVFISPQRGAAGLVTSDHWSEYVRLMRRGQEGGYEGRLDDDVTDYRLAFEEVIDSFLGTAGIEYHTDGTVTVPKRLGHLAIRQF